MKTIELKTPSGSSKILIEEGFLEKTGEFLQKKYPKSKFAIITDANIEKIYGEKIKQQLPKAQVLTVTPCEESKCFDVAINLAKKLLDAEFARNDVLIGFGGGMVTDLAGFIASIYMRGMKYVALPTSLIGIVDAAIGGKTGIDFHGKNLIGTFYLADYVLIDPNLLKSFPDIKKSPGWGEIIKYAGIYDASIFDEITRDPLDLNTVIQKSIQVKVDVVNQDYRETGLRRILNYGHTFGHAIESATKFQLTHDQAISIGMCLANRVAQKLNKQKPEIDEKIRATLKAFNLPTELPKELSLDALTDLIKKDKKRQGDIINFIIVTELGKAEIIPLKPEELVKLAQ